MGPFLVSMVCCGRVICKKSIFREMLLIFSDGDVVSKECFVEVVMAIYIKLYNNARLL